MAHVMTVLGPVDPDAIGLTSCHEHALIDLTAWLEQPATVSERALAEAPVTIEILGRLLRDPLFVNVDNYKLYDSQTAIDELKRFRAAGGSTIVDVTNVGLGRDPRALRWIAQESGVHIVAGAGFYIRASHPDYVAGLDEGEVAERIVADLRDGIDGTGIRAGIIGEIGTSEDIHPDERKVLRAAARAQQVTGAAINVHTFLWAQRGVEALDVLAGAGADLSRVVVSHVDHGVIDLDYQVEIIRRGAYVEYDGFGKEWYVDPRRTWFPRDTERAAAVAALFERGHGDRVVAGCDVCVKIQLTRYGGWGYEHLPANVPPLLRTFGLGDKDLQQLLVDNPRRLLTIDDRRPGGA